LTKIGLLPDFDLTIAAKPRHVRIFAAARRENVGTSLCRVSFL